MYDNSPAFAQRCAEVRDWCEASENFWLSTGAERTYWRGVFRHMIVRERERLAKSRAALHAAYLRTRETSND